MKPSRPSKREMELDNPLVSAVGLCLEYLLAVRVCESLIWRAAKLLMAIRMRLYVTLLNS
jgi:hypothetical protein